MSPLLNAEPLPRILLIDDDTSFGRIMVKFSEKAALPLTYCSSVEELESIDISKFDVAILDYELQNITGVQLARLLSRLGLDIPVMVISSYQQISVQDLPPCVVSFVPKTGGPLEILSKALETFHRTSTKEDV
jgi:two-component system, NtrC family, response regulator HydG